MTSRVVFVDKDGTLIDNVPMNVDTSRMRLTRGADVALARLSRAGYRVVVISNQAGVAFGKFPESALAGVEERLRHMLAARGVALDGFHYCPHHPEGTVERYRKRCRCRKPAPGLIERAAKALDADLADSWMIGDILDDVEAGRRAGTGTILFDSGGETEWKVTPLRRPDMVVSHFEDIADVILGAHRSSAGTRHVLANDDRRAHEFER